MKQKFNSIRSRIILFSAGFALMLAVFVSTVSYVLFQDFLRDNQTQAAQNNLQLLGNQLDSDLTDIVLFTNWCGIDTEIRNYLIGANSIAADGDAEPDDTAAKPDDTATSSQQAPVSAKKRDGISGAADVAPANNESLQNIAPYNNEENASSNAKLSVPANTSADITSAQNRPSVSETVPTAGNTALSAVYENSASGDTPASEERQRQRQLALNAWNQFSQEFNKVTARNYMSRSIISTMDGFHFIQIQPSPSFVKGTAPEILMRAPFFHTLLDSSTADWIGLVKNPMTTYQNPKVIPILRPIYNAYSSAKIGWIYVEISPAIVTDLFKNFQLADDSALYIRFANGAAYRFDSGELVDASGSMPQSGLVSYRLTEQGWEISQLLSQKELHLQQRWYFMIIAAIFFIIIIMGLCLMLLLNVTISVPVNAIIRRIARIGTGDFSRDPSIEWDNEMGRIGRGINDLSENVHALMEKKVQDEKTRQELEYKILQSQINPHFLYNTLNSIKWMATIQGAEGIADMTTALSRLMKNVAKGSDSLIPLRDEKALLDDYFTIMRYRYGGSVELEYQIDDDALLDCRVHRFSLQPIVENAIFHGIEPKGGAGRIVIHVWEELRHTAAGSAAPLRCLMISITDNGIGMDAETIERVMTGESGSTNDFFKHVGVSNVNQRIRFTFGDAYGISIQSEPGEYTTMTFTLPYLQ